MTENGIDRRRLLKLIGAGGVALVGVGAEGGVFSRLAAFASPEDAAAATGHVARRACSRRRRPRGRTSSTRS